VKQASDPQPCRVCGEPVLWRSGLSNRIHSACRTRKQARPERAPAPAYKLTRAAKTGATKPNADIGKGVHRSEALRQSARDEICVACGANDGTVVWAHANEGALGKGKSLKAHDLLGNYLCARCHADYDAGPGTREEKRAFFRECYPKTMVRVAEKIAAGTLRL